MKLTRLVYPALGVVLLTGADVEAQVNARMLRQPDVSATEIAFVYAGDIWVAPRTGGEARRLSSPAGEESFPRFSPDGSEIAFTGNYDGNSDIYVIPSDGGDVRRLTYHPAPDRMLDWYPDGSAILYASPMASGRQRFNQLYRLSVEGGLPERLPVPYGEFGAISPDGMTLAYQPKSRDFRTWKRYRGGWAPDIWLFGLTDTTAVNVTHHEANDAHPMWHGDTMYFLSDRGEGQRYNIWRYELASQDLRQVTTFTDDDVHFPAVGPTDIVFEVGGRLYLLDLATDQYDEVYIDIVSDFASVHPRTENVGRAVQGGDISPTGQRAVLEARGEIFSLPAGNGVTRNLTMSSGVAERTPAWSPDGRLVAYWSDRTGEYELTLRNADGSGTERTVTSLGPGFRYRPFWSPDSRKIAYIDQAMNLHILDVETGRVVDVDHDPWMTHGALEDFTVSWSRDSRWLAYHRGLDTRNTAIFLYDTNAGVRHQVTSGYYADRRPQFAPDGDYLFFLSQRTYEPAYSDFDNSFAYPNATDIVAVSLRDDVPSPLAPRNDTEGAEEDTTAAAGGQDTPVTIDLDGFETRLEVLPVRPGNYTDLRAVSGKVLYRVLPRTGSGGRRSPVAFFDLKDESCRRHWSDPPQECQKVILADADGYEVSHDGKKIIAVNADTVAIVAVAPEQNLEKPLALAAMEMRVDPRTEWRQIFNDAWRFYRDYFYDDNMHGVDWDAVHTHYGQLLDDAVTRWDVNFVIGEMIAELNSSHTYRGGGDEEEAPTRRVGLLGVDWSFENGAYRIARIVRGAPWDNEARSPLDEPGVNVSVGDYVLAVNGIALDPARGPWAAFEGLANETVVLTVSDRPVRDGARDVIVRTLTSEDRLRHLEWIEANRRRVDEASDGRIGYIYVPNTGVDGQNELVRQFNSQIMKDGLIIDERFNSGGQIPDRFIELLNRKPLAFWSTRAGEDWQWPPIAHFGPKVMLVNGWSGSGGDAFPYYFKEAGLGPLIGMRTWGGLIGVSGVPLLIDGGGVTVPTFRMYSVDGEWFAEGHGVDPDIEVVDDPAAMARGIDPQLERAIAEALRLVEENPPVRANRPGDENRAPRRRIIPE